MNMLINTLRRFSFLAADNHAKLDALREPIPERALYVSADEGAEKAHCFTNYEPHFNPPQRLDAVVMGYPPEGWRLVNHATWPESEKVYGYKDTKPFYEVCSRWAIRCAFFWLRRHIRNGSGGMTAQRCDASADVGVRVVLIFLFYRHNTVRGRRGPGAEGHGRAPRHDSGVRALAQGLHGAPALRAGPRLPLPRARWYVFRLLCTHGVVPATYE
jgi:hypothetical protein